MEEECRAMLGEGFCSRGWPKPAGVRRSMEKLLLNLKPAAEKLRRDYEAVEQALADAEKDHDATAAAAKLAGDCLLYTSPSPRDRQKSRMPSSA